MLLKSSGRHNVDERTSGVQDWSPLRLPCSKTLRCEGLEDLQGVFFLSELSLWLMAQSSWRVSGGCGLSAGPRRELQAAASSARRAGHQVQDGDGDGAGKSPL